MPPFSLAKDDDGSLPAFCHVGATVRAWGSFGEYHLFTAKVLAHRDRFPRLMIEYLSDASGSTHAIALPRPKVAFVHSGMVQEQ